MLCEHEGSAHSSHQSAITQEQLDALSGRLDSSDQAPASPGSMMGTMAEQAAPATLHVSSIMTQAPKKQRSPRAVSNTTPKRLKMYEDDTSSTELAGGEAEPIDDNSVLQNSTAEHHGLQGPGYVSQQQGGNGTVFSPSFHVPRNRRPSLDAHHQLQHLQPNDSAVALEPHSLHPHPHIPQPDPHYHHQYHHIANGTSLPLVPTAMPQAPWTHIQPPVGHPLQEPCALEDEAREEPMLQADSEETAGAAIDGTADGPHEAAVGMLPQAQLHHHQIEVHHVVPEAVEQELAPEGAAEAAEAEDELDYMDFDPLLFIKLLPPLEQVVPKHRKPLLPRKTRVCKQKTLVLDLDETLVHSCLDAAADADFTFPVHFNAQEHMIHVKQRPHLHTFMNRVAELFEVVVFTASQKVYAERLLNIIDPERKLIKHRIFRESCVIVDGNYLKDLSSLGRDLRFTLIVDNSPQAFGFQVDNGVPIESWYDDPTDTELLKLLPFLEELVAVEDVRPAIRNKFRMQELIDRVVC